MRTLIVPCAGQREINGEPVFLKKHPDGTLFAKKAIEGCFPESYDRIVYVVLKEDSVKYSAKMIIEKELCEYLQVEVLELDRKTEGAADTVYQAITIANIIGEITIKDSHNYIKLNSYAYGNMACGLDLSKYEGKIEELRAKGYIVVNEQNQILDIVMKSFRSDIMSAGLYGFRSASEFLDVYKTIKAEHYPIEKLYVLHIIEYMIGTGMAVFYCKYVSSIEEWGDATLWSLLKDKYSNPLNHSSALKLIISDLDGTLIDTKRANYLAYKEALEKYQISITENQFMNECFGKGYKEFLPIIGVSDVNIMNDIHETKKKVYHKYFKDTRLNNELLRLLIKTMSSTKIALVTTASKENAEQILDFYNLKNFFDLIITANDVSKNKPDPECYIKALDYFKVKGDEAMAFEDTLDGKVAANRAGIQCCLIGE